MNKCIFCDMASVKNNLCEKHYELVRKEYNKSINKDESVYNIKEHYHNLRHSIMKGYGLEYFVNNGIKLLSLAFLYLKKTNNSSLIESCMIFLQKQAIIKSQTIDKNNDIKKQIINKEWSDIDNRLKWTKNVICEDGHTVRSLSESLIDNWLYNHHITHAYEKKCIIDTRKSIILNPDFYIPEIDVYIEYWGRYDKKYLSHKYAKKEIYKEYGINIISIEANDILNINDVLISEFLKYGKNIKKDN